MACSNCGNDWCTGCTSTLAHCAGDPWDPADSKYDRDPPRRDAKREPAMAEPQQSESGVSTLPHCAGDPWDPADSKYDLDHPRRDTIGARDKSEPKPPPARELWGKPCPRCGGVVEITGHDWLPGPINSEFPLTEITELACRGCTHAWQIEE